MRMAKRVVAGLLLLPLFALGADDAGAPVVTGGAGRQSWQQILAERCRSTGIATGSSLPTSAYPAQSRDGIETMRPTPTRSRWSGTSLIRSMVQAR